MNYHLAALVAVGALIAVGALRLIYCHVCGLNARTASDVYPFLLKIDMELIYGTFHPDAEKHFREALSKEEFKKTQFKRIHLAIHYCNQLSNNVQVLLSWIRYERKQGWIATSSVGIQRNVQDLRIACVQFLCAAFIIRVHLRWWLFRMALLPFAAPPKFDQLLAAGSWEMITLYERIQRLAELFSLCFGDEYHDKLMGAL